MWFLSFYKVLKMTLMFTLSFGDLKNNTSSSSMQSRKFQPRYGWKEESLENNEVPGKSMSLAELSIIRNAGDQKTRDEGIPGSITVYI